MINRLQGNHQTDGLKQNYISGAPQCATPDVHLADAIANSWFDFIFVQFYNTPECSARAAVNYGQGTGSDDISFDAWAKVPSLNPNVKVYIGLGSICHLQSKASTSNTVASKLVALLPLGDRSSI
jgi:chitinase